MSKYSSLESYLKTELLRHNTDPEVAEIRVTKRNLSEVNRQLKL